MFPEDASIYSTKVSAERKTEIVDSWKFLLQGLWWSGLRLGEALALHWTDDRELCVDFSDKRPMFRIQPEAQKSNKAEILPMAPEFSSLLFTVPEVKRTGYVFNPARARTTKLSRLRIDNVSSTICRFGEHAGVKVAESGVGKLKYASAHDLRRAFGFRWSQRVLPAVLQQLMRHADINTTMEFYVGRNAQSAAEALWTAVEGIELPGVANTSANSTPQGKEKASEENDVSP